jgi:hypothetical protein
VLVYKKEQLDLFDSCDLLLADRFAAINSPVLVLCLFAREEQRRLPLISPQPSSRRGGGDLAVVVRAVAEQQEVLRVSIR